MTAYPATHMRRLRRYDWTRRMVAENLMLDWARDVLRKHGPRVIT